MEREPIREPESRNSNHFETNESRNGTREPDNFDKDEIYENPKSCQKLTWFFCCFTFLMLVVGGGALFLTQRKRYFQQEQQQEDFQNELRPDEDVPISIQVDDTNFEENNAQTNDYQSNSGNINRLPANGTETSSTAFELI